VTVAADIINPQREQRMIPDDAIERIRAGEQVTLTVPSKTSKQIIDEIVGLCNVLVHRHILTPDPDKPEWFRKQIELIDFESNTLQSALDEPQDEEDEQLAAKLTTDPGEVF
jgi:hypothetical protein